MNINILTKFKILILPVIFIGALLIMFASPFVVKTSALSGSSFNASRIIDDSVFFDSNSMGAQDVQAFLSSKVPNCDTNHAAGGGYNPPFTCLKDYRQNISGKSADAYCTGAVGGGTKSAAQIIKDVSVACSISPKVLIVLLQKEQSLITDTWPWPNQYEKATGYACSDTAPCDPEFAGFFNQIWYAARQFQRYVKQPQSFNFAYGKTSFVSYQANNPGCGGTNITIQNSATAALYNYTPYQPNAAALNNLYGTGDGCSAYGNRNFWKLFNLWFGSTLTDRCNYETPLPAITDVKFRKLNKDVASGSFVIYTGSSTNCLETHEWNSGFGSWQDHTASNLPAIDPSLGFITFADLNGDGKDEPIFIAQKNTGSGMIEFHVWEYSMKKWIVHAISNLSTSSTSNLSFYFADLNGDKIDEPITIGYKDTSTGKIEFHVWGPGVSTWQSHTISNLPAPIDPMNMQIRFADLNGDGKDEPIAIGLNNTSTGKIEFHVWNPDLSSWKNHIVSNSDIINVSITDLSFADLNGDKIDDAVLVGKSKTSTGKIEFHVWNPDLSSWKGHYISNQLTIQ